MDHGHPVGIDDQEPLLSSGGGPPIEEEDQPLSRDVTMKTPALSAANEQSELMGWLPELLWAEPRVRGPAERRVWAPGSHGGPMDHHPGAF